MNYELAKQLKYAGFPQGEPYNNYLYCDEHEDLEHTEECSAYIPTLEELIEACGEDLIEITFLHDKNEVIAKGFNVEIPAITALEAVARLWLKLQEVD